MTKDIVYKEAFCEVLYLINDMDEKNKAKISEKFIKFLNDKKSKDYKFDKITLDNPNSLKRETKIILSIMYRNYFCDSQKRKELEISDKRALDELYSYENIFKSKNKFKYSEHPEGTKALIKEKNNFKDKIKNILAKIKRFFRFNKK